MLNNETVFRDAYKLLCIFLADRAIFEMTPPNQQVYGGSRRSEEPLYRLRHQLVDDEINHTLINLAIYNRTHMELMKERFKRENPATVCGKLVEGTQEETTKDLLFREACNKIIHAKTFRATCKRDGIISEFSYESSQSEPMHHEFWFFGDHKKKWKAKLNILDFLRATTENFDLF